MEKKRAMEEEEEEEEVNSPCVKRQRWSSVLDILDDEEVDVVVLDDEKNSNLDDMLRNLEEEIDVGRHDVVSTGGSSSTSCSSSFGLPDLGYLMGASDDELGLPPTVLDLDPEEVVEVEESLSSSPVAVVTSREEVSGFDVVHWDYDDDGFYDFGLAADLGGNFGGEDDGLVVLGGLFDFPEDDLQFRLPESMPAA